MKLRFKAGEEWREVDVDENEHVEIEGTGIPPEILLTLASAREEWIGPLFFFNNRNGGLIMQVGKGLVGLPTHKPAITSLSKEERELVVCREGFSRVVEDKVAACYDK